MPEEGKPRTPSISWSCWHFVVWKPS